MRQKRGGVDERGPLPRTRIADGASSRVRHWMTIRKTLRVYGRRKLISGA